MNRRKRSVPEGMRDLLFEECALKRRIERSMGCIFEAGGYREIITPALEYLELYSDTNSLPAERMYKLFDRQSRILALRPDCTPAVARVAATRLMDMPVPLRLYYNQNVFRTNDTMSAKSDETTQCGVELIGAAGPRADIEVLRCALAALRSVTDDFKLELGHVGMFWQLSRRAGLSEEDTELARFYIETKNFAALDSLAGEYGKSAEGLKLLPRLFGGEEVFDEAAAVSEGETGGILAYLRGLFDTLSEMGYRDHIMMDLGLVSNIEYYTGVVFCGYLGGFGKPALFGGRYDELMKKFGRDMPAAGFAIDVDAVADTIQNGQSPLSPPDALVYCESACLSDAYRLAERLQGEGKIALVSTADSEKAAGDEAKALGAATLYAVTKSGVRSVDVGGGFTKGGGKG